MILNSLVSLHRMPSRLQAETSHRPPPQDEAPPSRPTRMGVSSYLHTYTDIDNTLTFHIRLDNNDEKCATWWERVKVEGTTITAVERVAKPIIDDVPYQSKVDYLALDKLVDLVFSLQTVTPTFSLQEFNAATTSNPATLVLSETAKKFKCDLCTVDMWFAFKKSLYAHLLKNHDR